MADWEVVAADRQYPGVLPVQNTFVHYPDLPEGAGSKSMSDPGPSPCLRPMRTESPIRQHSRLSVEASRADDEQGAIGSRHVSVVGGAGGDVPLPAAARKAKPGKRERQEKRMGEIPLEEPVPDTLQQTFTALLAACASVGTEPEAFLASCSQTLRGRTASPKQRISPPPVLQSEPIKSPVSAESITGGRIAESPQHGSPPLGPGTNLQVESINLAQSAGSNSGAVVAPTVYVGKGRVALFMALGSVIIIIAALVALLCHYRRPVADVMSQTAADIMMEHSKQQLSRSWLGDSSDASVAMLQDKLHFSQMSMDLNTQVFQAKRGDVKELMKSMCDLPGQICNSMVAAASAIEAKYHRKHSVPLDDNSGSYVAVWMWIKPTSDDDTVQVAFKSSSLSYRLRDVVTYREQVDEEPEVRCVTDSSHGWFSTSHSQRCTQVGVRKTVTPIPVFKQAVMNPNEMALVDMMMERLLAQKVLDDQGDVRGIDASATEGLARPGIADEL